MALVGTVRKTPNTGGDGSYSGLAPNLNGSAFAISTSDICPVKKYMVCWFARAVIRNY